MTTYEFRRTGRHFDAAGLGSFQRRAWYTNDGEALVAGEPACTFSRSGWGRVYTAKTGTFEVGRFEARGGWRTGGALTWHGVRYEVTTASQWKGSLLLSRYGVELARFTPHGWRTDIRIDVPGDAPPAGLLVFVAWITWVLQQGRAAAAG